MCGEHGGVNNYNNPTLGSSPHVRGAHAMTGEKTQVYGIIPACAGSTRPNLDCPRLWGDHPRMYGEHDNQQPDAYRPVGSSPHVRGARQACDDALQESGIIPACAGSTTVGKTKLLFIWDHPRMCGEHADGNKTIQGAKGSSPHVRGALARRFASGSATGIIPACAGSTPMSPTGRGAMWDHPRMCGEHSRPMKSRSNCGGSSPHVRGARQSRSLINLSLGIIPACAGSTSETALHPW